jgi:hypothetical protein
VGNVPTEIVLRALAEGGAEVPLSFTLKPKPLEELLRKSEEIALRFGK